MAKHSKVKNTGILFELLVRQITTDTLNGVEKSPAIAIIKEYFGKRTTLKTELHLYQTLLKEKHNTEYRAEKLVDLVIRERAKLSATNLRREKYNLIREIKKNYDVEQFFKAKIGKYKQNASIYTLFESINSKGYSNPKIILQSRANIVEHVCKNIKDSSHVDRVVEAFRQEDKDLRLLAYKVLVDKFNSKYNKLSESQASILREYINNISNTENLRGKLQKVVAENLKVLQKSMKTVEDPVVKIKLKEVAKQIKNSVLNKKRIDEKKILNVLRLSELVEEVRNVG
jgi:hypothetical protein|tara:strand:+ start:265 stop:1122 length:858 start_codon:yes stop_codon:yes gene_type:complete